MKIVEFRLLNDFMIRIFESCDLSMIWYSYIACSIHSEFISYEQ